MVTDAMIEAGYHAMRSRPYNPAREWVREIYAAMEAARPTADLGEDGEIVDRVAGWLDKQRAECAPSTLVGVATPVDELEELLSFARQAHDRLEASNKCSCGKPLPKSCPACERDWQS